MWRIRLGQTKMSKLIWEISMPMVLSMMLFAAYNLVDAMFVVNMGPEGINANLAITYAVPIQMLSAALGVGTGIGINALLSKSLGEKDHKKASKVTGNGIFAGICIYIVFLLFGIFLAEPFIKMQAGDNLEALKMGVDYLRIICCFSFGQIIYTIVERFLQSTGKTILSTISQITGSIINIVLDYIFIYPLHMGIQGAAWATVIGQIVSLILGLTFHFLKNKSIKTKFKDLIPHGNIIKEIYTIGFSASLMQGLISIMMLGAVMILGLSHSKPELLQGTYGIYFKIAQFALFACFGMSNGIITIMSYNYGKKSEKRCKQCAKYGLIMTLIVTGTLTVLLEALSYPIALLFSLTGGATQEITETVAFAIRIGATSFIFMGITISIQGMLQAFRYSILPLILSALRLVVLLFPALYLLSLADKPEISIWFAMPIVETITLAVAILMIIPSFKKTMKKIEDEEDELVMVANS